MYLPPEEVGERKLIDRLFRLFHCKSKSLTEIASAEKQKIGDVTLEIEPEDGQLRASDELARMVVESIAEVEARAKSIASAELLDTYNTSWRGYHEVQDDGSLSDVDNPEINTDEFERALKLTIITITSGQSIDFYFEDGDLFGGHLILVTSFDGLAMSEANASLMG